MSWMDEAAQEIQAVLDRTDLIEREKVGTIFQIIKDYTAPRSHEMNEAWELSQRLVNEMNSQEGLMRAYRLKCQRSNQ